jgi:hypothetical protein
MIAEARVGRRVAKVVRLAAALRGVVVIEDEEKEEKVEVEEEKLQEKDLEDRLKTGPAARARRLATDERRSSEFILARRGRGKRMRELVNDGETKGNEQRPGSSGRLGCLGCQGAKLGKDPNGQKGCFREYVQGGGEGGVQQVAATARELRN